MNVKWSCCSKWHFCSRELDNNDNYSVQCQRNTVVANFDDNFRWNLTNSTWKQIKTVFVCFCKLLFWIGFSMTCWWKQARQYFAAALFTWGRSISTDCKISLISNYDNYRCSIEMPPHSILIFVDRFHVRMFSGAMKEIDFCFWFNTQ